MSWSWSLFGALGGAFTFAVAYAVYTLATEPGRSASDLLGLVAQAPAAWDGLGMVLLAMGAMAGMAGHGDMKGMEMKTAAKSSPQERKVQDLNLVLTTQPDKPKAGENVVRLRITDNAGQPIKDAQVSFLFSMAMPGMVPSRGDGKLTKDGLYETKTNLSMAGPWEVTVTIRRAGKKEIQEKFSITAQ